MIEKASYHWYRYTGLIKYFKTGALVTLDNTILNHITDI